MADIFSKTAQKDKKSQDKRILKKKKKSVNSVMVHLQKVGKKPKETTTN